MNSRSVMGFLFVGLIVLGTVFVYNRFLAEKGKTIANLGEKT